MLVLIRNYKKKNSLCFSFCNKKIFRGKWYQIWVFLCGLFHSDVQFYCVDDRMISERWIWKDLEGSGRGVIEVTSRDLPEDAKKNYKTTKQSQHGRCPCLDCTEKQFWTLCFASEWKWVNFYSFSSLNPHLKKKICYHLTFFWNFRSCFLSLSTIFLLFSLESTIV